MQNPPKSQFLVWARALQHSCLRSDGHTKYNCALRAQISTFIYYLQFLQCLIPSYFHIVSEASEPHLPLFFFVHLFLTCVCTFDCLSSSPDTAAFRKSRKHSFRAWWIFSFKLIHFICAFSNSTSVSSVAFALSITIATLFFCSPLILRLFLSPLLIFSEVSSKLIQTSTAIFALSMVLLFPALLLFFLHFSMLLWFTCLFFLALFC